MNLSDLLDEIQTDLLGGDFDAEIKYATHFLKIESLKKIPPQELKANAEDNKDITEVYKNLAELSTTSELTEMIDTLADRLAFYMALSQMLEVRHMASQVIINKLVSGELKPGKSQKAKARFDITQNSGDDGQKRARRIWDIGNKDILRDFLK